jgi:hypothetical protein
MEFKKELTENEIKRAIRLFDSWESQNLIITHGNRERTVELTYGLPYTSSSDYAMLNNTNVEALYPRGGYLFNGLAVSTTGQTFALLADAEERERFIEL